MKIFEGMRAGDLEDLVLPMVSIDEYDSKVGDNDQVMVVGFYVHDVDAAADLNRFIQKSAVSILDSEVSPAPDQHGFYLVFVELMNDDKLVDAIETMLEEISPLIADDEWQMQVKDIEEVMPFSRKVLRRHIAQSRKEQNIEKQAEPDNDAVVEFLTHSDLNSAIVEDERVTITANEGAFDAVIVGLGPVDELILEHGLDNTAISLDFYHVGECKRIAQMLGEGWITSRIGSHTLVQKHGLDEAMLLKNHRFR